MGLLGHLFWGGTNGVFYHFSGPAGVSHWVHPSQQEEFRDLKVLVENFKAIRGINQVPFETPFHFCCLLLFWGLSFIFPLAFGGTCFLLALIP